MVRQFELTNRGADRAPVALPNAAEGKIAATDERVRANVAWMLVGNVWLGVTQWLLVVALAKLGTIEMVGSFTLGLAIGLPVLMFSSLSLRSFQLTDGTHTYRFLDYLMLRFTASVAALVLIAGIAASARYSAPVVATVTLICAAKAGEYCSDTFYGLLQRRERMAGIAFSMMLRGTLSLVALGTGIWLTGSLLWGATGMLAASMLTLLAFDLPRSLALLNLKPSAALRVVRRYATALVDGRVHRRLGALAWAGLPLGAVLMLVALNLSLPRYFIERSLGIRELGIFSSIANLLAAGNVLTNAVATGVTPRLAKYFEAAKMRDFRALLTTVVVASLALGACGLAGALLFGRQILTLVYRPEYSRHQDILVWLMAASGFVYLGSTLGGAVTAVKCFTPQLPLFGIAAGTTAVASMILVPSQGLRGAALAILISAIVQCAGGARLLRNQWKRAGTAPIPAVVSSVF
jgi:O-antigen/teichoic acid export membrane protein